MDYQKTNGEIAELTEEDMIYEALSHSEEYDRPVRMMKIQEVPDSADFYAISAGIAHERKIIERSRENVPERKIVCLKRIIAPIVIFVRKVLRKFILKWYIEPLCERQTTFNVSVSNAISGMSDFSERQLEAMNQLFLRCRQLEEALEEERGRREALEARLSALEEENNPSDN